MDKHEEFDLEKIIWISSRFLSETKNKTLQQRKLSF
jgi:hypothetical protein